MKAKLTCTMYFDYDGDGWDWDKPDYGRCGEDYMFLRKGSIFKMYQTDEELEYICSDLEIENKYAIICADKRGNWFGFGSVKDFLNCGYFKAIN